MTQIEQLEKLYGICGEFHGYKLVPVFNRTTPETRQMIIKLWEKNRALPKGADAEARARQVVIMVIGQTGEAVAVSTVYKSDFAHTGMKNAPAGMFYFFRTFVQPADRIHNLSAKITTCTYDHLKNDAEPHKPQGLVIVAENPKLTGPVLQRLLGSAGWAHIGEDPRGKIVMRQDF